MTAAERSLARWLALVWAWAKLVTVLPWCVAMAIVDHHRHRPPSSDNGDRHGQ